LVGAHGWRIETEIAVKIVRDTGNGQARAHTWTERRDVQINRRSASVGIEI
jgi:hypothetical protein